MAELEQTEPNGGDKAPPASESAGLLAARRHFLAGSIGISAFAATLSSRRAYAWSGGGHGCVTELCSPNHSHGSKSSSVCVGNHCDHYCQNAMPSNWAGFKCSEATFGSCGWGISPAGCSVVPSQRLCDALNNCYQQAPQQSYYGFYGYQGSQSESCNNNVQQYQQWGQQDSPCGLWVYQSSCNSSQAGYCGWLAACLLNCLSPGASWYYDCPSLISACQRVYDSKCVANCEPVLCSLFSSICPNNQKPEGCGGSSCLWNNR
jgi:hypothetical protein